MVQNAVRFAVSRYHEKEINPTMAFVREGHTRSPFFKDKVLDTHATRMPLMAITGVYQITKSMVRVYNTYEC